MKESELSAMKDCIILFSFFVFWISIVVWQTMKRKGIFGVNFREVRCPQCDIVMPRERIPASLQEALRGGWTCPKCGLKLNKWGEAISEFSGISKDAQTLKGKIIIKRSKNFIDRNSIYNIMVDGQMIGQIPQGTSVEIDLNLGPHEIHCMAEIARFHSNIISFVLKDEIKKFEVRPHLRGLRALLVVFYFLFLPSKCIELEEVQA